MLRRTMVICASGIALVAAVAHAAPAPAYKSWSVSAAVNGPTVQEQTIDIKENGSGISLAQKLAGDPAVVPTPTWTYFKQFAAPAPGSVSYEITARPGYDIRSVLVDGRAVTVSSKNQKTVTFDNTRLLHTLVVNTVAEKYSVTTSVAPARKGAFSPAALKNIAYGKAKEIKVVPAKGWEIATVTDNTVPLANALNSDGTMTISFQNTIGEHALVATFRQLHDVKAVISPAGDRAFDVDKGAVTFELDAIRSTSAVQPATYQWQLTGAPDATYASLSAPAGMKTVFTASKPGTYAVTLTVSDGSVSNAKVVVFTARTTTLSASASCMNCHKDAADAENASIVTKFTGSAHAVANSGPSCGSCHGNHSTGKLNPANSCAQCHATSAHQGAALTKACIECHDNHSTTAGAPHFGGKGTATVKGQWVAPATLAGTGACADCHAGGNVTANAAILVEYAESGHGDVAGDGWVHYDWRSTSRATCGRCHTSSGYISIQTGGNGMPFDGVNDAAKAPEVLRCNGCHSDVSTGALYDPGAVTVKNTSGVTVLGETGQPIVQPDAQKSSGCLYCHSGAGNMFTAWSNSRIASHHAVAGAVLFGTNTRIGFEFQVDADGAGGNPPAYLDYGIPAHMTSAKHGDIGMADGEAGPCVGCHMPTKNHGFEAVDTATQTIRSQALCNTCHTVGGPYEMTYAKLEEEKEGYNEAGAVLAAYIANTIPNYKGAAIAGGVTNADPVGLNNDRAAWYNSKLFPTEDKGAFAHNRFYTKRLMFDAIDWLQDGILNGTITIDAAYPKAAAWLGTTRP